MHLSSKLMGNHLETGILQVLLLYLQGGLVAHEVGLMRG
jgi:hypothetical protein